MGLRFRKSVKIAPGVKVNFNKKSVGITAGVKGAHVTVNSKGRKTTSVGIPGTGLSYVETSKIGKPSPSAKNNSTSYSSSKPLNKQPPEKPKPARKTSRIVLFSFFIVLLGLSTLGGIISCLTEGVDLLDISMFILIGGLIGLSFVGLSRARKPYSDGGNPLPPVKKSRGFKISILLLICGFLLGFAAPSTPSAPEVESITLKVAVQEMDIDKEQEVTLSITPDDATAENLSFESSDESVVTFSGDTLSGKIQSHKEGEAYIYVVADNGIKSKKIKITVIDKEAIKKAEEAAAAEKKAEEERQQQLEEEQSQTSQTYVYIPQSGSKYHSNPNCSNMNNPSQVTLERALELGFEPCKKCY